MPELAICNFCKILKVLQNTRIIYLLSMALLWNFILHMLSLYIHITVQHYLPESLYSIFMGNLGVFQGFLLHMIFNLF